ncbi:hypothetical protein R3W88_011595 [Solanum pinnatisectum]|uniref:Uncharacterized protein n=1 Tax=Solanum pinnatisectum TaxID=50273 RepID=A0AAV9LAG2_9SOLN|nr:hypothetical protein R3W88_011595 [Solanum pinnatisectum]
MVQILYSNVQFTGLPHEDPQIHLRNFINITDTYILIGVSSNYVRLTLFPYSLLGATRCWLDSEPPNSITTWDYLGEMPRTTTQKAVGILDVDQATAINAKLDAMQHNMTLHFKQMALNHAPVNIVQQAANLCEVCGSGTYETDQCEANPNFVNYMGNAQRGGVQQNYGNTYKHSWRNHPNFSWGGNQNQNQAQGLTNTVLKGLGNNTKILTKAQILVHQNGG